MPKVRIQLVYRCQGQEVYHLTMPGAISAWQAVVPPSGDRWKVLAEGQKRYLACLNN